MARRHKRGKSKSAKLARLGQLGILKHGKHILEKQNKAVKKQQILVAKEAIEKEQAKMPHSFVIYNGSVGKYVRMLMMDIRKVLEPFTASQLKVQKRNNVKDFIVNGAILGLSHMIVLTKSDSSVNMRLLKTPQGPTLQFKVNSYTLFRDVIAASKRPVVYEKLMSSCPLLIMNGFADSHKKELKLVESVLQNMFPELRPDKVLLRNVRRCVLFNYDEESDTISMRHYAIKVVPTDISKSTKKIIKDKVPDLSKYKDISEFFLNPGHLSESEFEGEQNEVELAEDLPGKGCLKGMKSNVRMIEIGPRLDLTLTKILEGIDEGEVLYNRYVTKSAEEVKKLRSIAPTLKSRRKKRERIVNVRVVRRLKNAQKLKAESESQQEHEYEQEEYDLP
ncbi:Protein Peter pan [Strongyloides ratti]|uniref:Protein Peter pan n=1 Tax=Strongyloides ratti TaxID=34506 RepID=A0A090L217_STRRB|nr:Protein Peter pan [Strongyloides ratti]CEF63856.1 Protein Peter pan [Strongyloides ratti]